MVETSERIRMEVPKEYNSMKAELEKTLGEKLNMTVKVERRVDKFDDNGMLKASVFTIDPKFKEAERCLFAEIEHKVTDPKTDHYQVEVLRWTVPSVKRISRLNFLRRKERDAHEKMFADVANIFRQTLRKEGRNVVVSDFMDDL